MESLQLNDFPSITYDKLRYGDTDRQGHINNANFSSFLETGREHFLYDPAAPVLPEQASFVIASLRLNFRLELTWPGQVDIGTGILKIGNSSMVIYQKLFQTGIEVADAETVVVQVDDSTGKSLRIGEEARQILTKFELHVDPQ